MSEPPEINVEAPALPSLKALGKRPERRVEQSQLEEENVSVSAGHTADDAAESTPTLSKPPAKKKSRLGINASGGKAAPEEATKRRVLPQRNRRGGPGVGNTAIDAMILDSQQKSRK